MGKLITFVERFKRPLKLNQKVTSGEGSTILQAAVMNIYTKKAVADQESIIPALPNPPSEIIDAIKRLKVFTYDALKHVVTQIYGICLDLKIEASLAYIDIDGLKAINQNCGQSAGDEVVRTVRHLVEEYFGLNFITQTAQDEFLTFIHGMTHEDTLSLLYQFRDIVSTYKWERIVPGLYVTVGIGYAAIDRAEEPSVRWYIRASEGCKMAKREGKNIVKQGPMQVPRHYSDDLSLYSS